MSGDSCPVCGDTFSNESSLQEHSWDAHGACRYCGDDFEDRESLYTHWLTVHEDRLSSKTRARAESVVADPSFRDRLTHQGVTGAVTGSTVGRRALLAGSLLGVGGLVGGTLLTGSSGGTEIGDHAAATGLDTQPTLGPPPGEADGTIVAFEDPSCPSCGRFERRVFPRIQSNLVDTGTVSFVFRGIPVVHPWGDPAVHALEATYARSSEAFWALKRHYYREQRRIGTANVRDVTRRFLRERGDVDAVAVLDDVDGRSVRDAVQVDRQSSREAGVRGTPTFFLFRNGSFVTELVGAQSYDVFRNSLGV